MAIVLTLLIVGWLVAFALGTQAGFSNEEPVSSAAPTQTARTEVSSSYSEPASVS